MAREHHIPLFHPRIVRERIKSLDPSLFRKHEPTIRVWLGHLRSGALDETKEVSLHGGFLERIFCDLLGYPTMAVARDGKWELVAEKSVSSGGSADGAIGFFAKGVSRVIAPIELKGAAQFLEHAKGRSLTPIQQGWDYANKTPESRWIIVSNYRETRLYAKSRGQSAYELFQLEDLASEDGFFRFVALLGRDAILGGQSVEQSPLADMLIASERTEREITERLYAKYRGVRAQLFAELRRLHSNICSDELLACAQTILDRVLFLAFAEDRHLIPRDTIAHAYEHKDPYHPRPIWQNFLAVFRSVDKGNRALDIPLYNGGLFREVALLSELQVSDETCASFKELGEYDFAEDVSVEVLGHIFEQSITDLEQLRREAVAANASASTPTLPAKGTQKTPSKRKSEGIFFTPPFVTSFLVRETLGKTIADVWERTGPGRAENKKDRIEAWEAYQNQLRLIRVLDPSCGSGAFLISAFDTLAQEFNRVNRTLAELRGHQFQTSVFDLTKTILNENLFGVDKSGESVEITKLSLWLKTAQRGSRLTFLDRNIRQGNSVVSNPKLDPLAFDWDNGQFASSVLEAAHPIGEDSASIDARWREGFDVVLGNPPYIRQELLTDYKSHWADNFKAYDGAADIFVYFFERGIQRLKVGGRLGFIVSNKWLRGSYADKLRNFLSTTCTIQTLVDFGHAPIFPDADAFPCIITLRKLKPKPEHSVRVTQYPREKLGKELLASYVETHQFALPQSKLPNKGWVLESAEVLALLEKLKANSVTLGEYTTLKPSYGIKTGCNEAFLIDQTTKERLCREDPKSYEILKKYLRGQDIARWSPEWANLWIILLQSSSDYDWPWNGIKDQVAAEKLFAESFPAIYNHVKPFENRLRKRSDHGKFWWELRTCSYYDLFEQPKLVWKDISFYPEFAWDDAGRYTNDLCFILPERDPWLLATLNSPAMWAWLWRNTLHGKDEALRLKSSYLDAAPIPTPTDGQREAASSSIEAIVKLTRAAQEGTNAVLDLLHIQYGVEMPGDALRDFTTLTSDAFVREVSKRRGSNGAPLSPAGLRSLRDLFDSEVPGILRHRAQILAHERTIAGAVHAAYGLTHEDIDLLRRTATPRMPPGW